MTGDDQMLQLDEQARDQALDVTRSFIVQAPAGSGKTELLIQRYLRLLATVDEPEEVIAITFTRKAAAEMQHRVLEALRRAGRNERPEQAHEQRTIQLADDALERDAAHGWDLLVNPRRLRIQTLDSLNASIARSRPLSAPGNASGVRVVTDAELESLYRAAAIETLEYITIDGALHEFGTLDGVVEDITDIILNLKQVPFRLHSDHPETLSLAADGPGTVKSGDLKASELESLRRGRRRDRGLRPRRGARPGGVHEAHGEVGREPGADQRRGALRGAARAGHRATRRCSPGCAWSCRRGWRPSSPRTPPSAWSRWDSRAWSSP